MSRAPRTSILVIDDHPVFRAGMAAVLSKLEGSPAVREAGSAAEAWTALRSDPPSCATLDLQLGDGNGFKLLTRARTLGLPTRFVVVSLFADEQLRAQALALGASAFVPKERDIAEVVAAVREVLSRPAAQVPFRLPEEEVSLEARAPLLEALSRLTPAERLVLQLLSTNLTSSQIAARLALSPRTVQNHRAHICEKLGLRGNNRLLEVALELREVLGAPEE